MRIPDELFCPNCNCNKVFVNIDKSSNSWIFWLECLNCKNISKKVLYPKQRLFVKNNNMIIFEEYAEYYNVLSAWAGISIENNKKLVRSI